MWRIFLALISIVPSTAAPGHAQLQEEEAEARILGAPSDLDPEAADATDRVVVAPGTRVHGRPDVRSPAIAMIDAEIELPILDRRQHWVLVRYGSWKGWVATGDAADVAREGGGDHAAWRRALAREMLRPSARGEATSPRLELGPFALYTDVDDPRLLRFLSRIAGHLPAAYRDRYGLEPRLVAGDAVVLFAREEDYRAFEAEVRPESDRGALGHAAYGQAVLYVGRQGPEDVAAVMIHELTHVLTHRTLAQPPPPWLDEGMANDLAFCRIDAARRLDLGSLGGRSVMIEEHSYRPGGWIGVDRAVHLSGPLATRNLLRERWRAGRAIRLETLARLPAGRFFDPEKRQLHYDASAFLVRYLLDGDGGELAPGFRALLSAAAAGAPADPAALPTFLGRGWEELERAFAAWLTDLEPA